MKKLISIIRYTLPVVLFLFVAGCQKSGDESFPSKSSSNISDKNVGDMNNAIPMLKGDNSKGNVSNFEKALPVKSPVSERDRNRRHHHRRWGW